MKAALVQAWRDIKWHVQTVPRLSKIPRGYLICGKEGNSARPEFQPQHCHFELGWEVNTTHILAKRFVHQGHVTSDFTIVTLPGREFLYTPHFERVITWETFCQEKKIVYGTPILDAGTSDVLDLVHLFESNWHRHPSFYFKGPGATYDGAAWSLIQDVDAQWPIDVSPDQEFICVAVRNRASEPNKNAGLAYASDLLKGLRDAIDLPIMLVGLNLPDYGVRGVRGVSLAEWVGLFRDRSCRGIIGSHTGTMGVAGLLAPRGRKLLIAPLQPCPSIDGNYPTGMGKCLNLNRNIRKWLPVQAPVEQVIAEALIYLAPGSAPAEV